MTEVVLRLVEAKPAELAERLASCPALLVPLGTVEYHGNHLPLGLDGLKAEAIADEAARRSGAVVGPLNWWSADGVPRPYTLRLPAALIEPLLREAIAQFAGMGFRVISLVNGHFGLENSRLTRRLAIEAIDRGPSIVLPVAEYEVLLDLGDEGDHAGRWETSLLLGARPDLVALDAVPPSGPVEGVLGAQPHGANEAEGRQGIKVAGARIASQIQRALVANEVGRDQLQAALAAGLEALDVLAGLRAELPREQVPPVLTPAWAAHLRALDAGAYDDARAHAARKALDPAA